MPASTTDELLPPLTNQDVEILYTIVTTAATLPGPPYRALFAAYDRILAERGISTNHDRVYFRFLLRMRARNGSDDNKEGTASLYARFEQLLAEMGIQVEVDDNAEGVEDITRRFDDLDFDADGEGEGERDVAPAMLGKLARRASFDDTMYENTTGLKWRGEVEDDMLSRPHSRTGYRPRRSSSRSSDPSFRRTRRTSTQDIRPAMHSGFPHRGRLNRRTSSDDFKRSIRGRPRSVSSQGSLRITRTLSRDGYQPPAREPSFDDLDSFGSPRSRRSSIPGPTPEPMHYVPPEMLYRPSPAEMLADADTFLYARTLFKARQALRKWRDQAVRQQQLHVQMEEAADALNKRKLLDAALEMLSVTLKARRQQKETDRFFQQLERRAEKARNLFLLTKAFTHWANSAADEVERTSVARRHILRFKYFNAWHEITAVEELKVRRQQLSKFFGVWRRKQAAVQEDNDLALAFHSENLIQHAYRSCFWEFSERRAAKLYDEKLKKKIFAKLIDKLLQVTERQAAVQERREVELKRKSLRALSGRILVIQSNRPIADEFHQRNSMRSALEQVKLQTRLRPIERQASHIVENNLARQALAIWRLRAEQSRRAAEIDRLRILHNAFTAWNDELRCRTLAARIDERVLVEALYKWSLATRAALLSRLHTARIRHHVLRDWTDRVRAKRMQLAQAEQQFAAFHERRLKQDAFACLKNVLEMQRMREAQALSIHQPRLLNRTWHALNVRHEHIQQLEQWGTDAQFYTLTKHALTKWRESMHHAQRMRRRDAYATVRRRTKVALARRVFETWRGRAANVDIMARQAQEKHEDLVLHSATALLRQWRDSAVSILELEQQAEEVRRKKLIALAMGLWQSRLRNIEENDARAGTLLESHIFAEASNCLRKLQWRLFNVQRHEPTSQAFAERNFQKHVKSILRHWADQAMQAKQARKPRPESGVLDEEDGQEEQIQQEEEEEYEADRDTEHDATIARNENWTAFDESAFDLGNFKLNLNLFPPRSQRQGIAAINQQRSRSTSPIKTLPQPNLQPDPEPEFDVEREYEAPNPFALTINPSSQAAILSSTPLPGYLRTPRKSSTVRARRLAALNLTQSQNQNPASTTAPSASTFALPTNTGSTTPAAAPPSTFADPAYFPATVNAVATAPRFGAPAPSATSRLRPTDITPFPRKLERGLAGRTPGPGYGLGTAAAATPGTGAGRRLFGASGGGRFGMAGRGVDPGFGGFEDIAEDLEHSGSVEKGKERG